MTLRNRHTGDYPVDIVERSGIPVASVDNPRTKVFLKGPEGLATAEDGVEVDLGGSDGFRFKWRRDLEQAKMGRRKGSSFGTGSFLLARRWFLSAGGMSGPG